LQLRKKNHNNNLKVYYLSPFSNYSSYYNIVELYKGIKLSKSKCNVVELRNKNYQDLE